MQEFNLHSTGEQRENDLGASERPSAHNFKLINDLLLIRVIFKYTENSLKCIYYSTQGVANNKILILALIRSVPILGL